MIDDAALHWLANGRRGLSSEAMFTRMTGIPTAKYKFDEKAHPHDPNDLTRCIRLLEAVPSFAERIHEMADVSPEWAALVSSWDDLTLTLDSEVPGWRQDRHGEAPKTYKMMRSLIESAQ